MEISAAGTTAFAKNKSLSPAAADKPDKSKNSLAVIFIVAGVVVVGVVGKLFKKKPSA